MKAGALILAGVLAATTAYTMQDPPSAQDPARERDRQRQPGMTSDQIVPNQTVVGKVTVYSAGKSVTVLKQDGSTVTFTIPEKMVVTDNVTVGSKVTIRTSPTNPNVVESITLDTMKK